MDSTLWVGPPHDSDRYRLAEVIRRGSEGIVYSAGAQVSATGWETVAIKMMPPRPGDDDGVPWGHHANLISGLNIPGLVRVRDTFSGYKPHPAGTAEPTEGLPHQREPDPSGMHRYIVMDHVDGMTLAEWTQQHPETDARARLGQLATVAEALDALHARPAPVAHGDVTPANIIRRPDGGTVLVDFGLLQTADGSRTGRTRRYSAPELRGDHDAVASPATDRFGFAAVVAHVLLGATPPAADDHGPDLDLIETELRGSPITGHLPDLVACVLTALRAEPDARPPRLAGWLETLIDQVDAAAAVAREGWWTAALGTAVTDGLPPHLLTAMDHAAAGVPDLARHPVQGTWHQPGLAQRLARAAAILPRLTVPATDRVLVLGLVAVLEAGFQRTEHTLFGRVKSGPLPKPTSELGRIHAAKTGLDADRLLAWFVHLEAVEAYLQGPAVAADLASILAAVAPDLDGSEVPLAAGYLAECLRGAFRWGESMHEVVAVREFESMTGELVDVAGHRVAVLVKLLWQLALDTRLMAPELGLQLMDDDGDITAALADLDAARWTPFQGVLDLKLTCASGPIDNAIRDLVDAVNADLLAHNQAGGLLHQTKAPLAVVTTRLVAAKDAYRLPHLKFEISAAETYELLMGTQLYDNPMHAVREVYQNALDACLYRRYRERRRGNPDYQPAIEFRLTRSDTGAYLECRDNGVGMTHHELTEAFAKIGRRFRDLAEFRQEMDEDPTGEHEFRPISQFGIGVLSYFMIAETIELWTTRTARDGHTQQSLHVKIHGSGALFHVTPLQQRNPQDGTVLRLHLKPQFHELNALVVLVDIIRAPLVETRLHTADDVQHWRSGLLYDGRGYEVTPCLAFPELGVYFHEGQGWVLANGIPVGFGESSNDAPDGVTVSLDTRSAAVLSINRERLLTYDDAAVRALLRAGARQVAAWEDASTGWLADLFGTDGIAGSIAYRSLKDARRSVVFGSHEDGREPLVVDLRSVGFSHLDTDLQMPLPRVGNALRAARKRIATDPLAFDELPGLPDFDQRLAVLITAHRQQILSRGREDHEAMSSINHLARAGEVLGVPIGATVAYFWALRLFDRPDALFFFSAAGPRYANELTDMVRETWFSVAAKDVRELEGAAEGLKHRESDHARAIGELSPAAAAVHRRGTGPAHITHPSIDGQGKLATKGLRRSSRRIHGQLAARIGSYESLVPAIDIMWTAVERHQDIAGVLQTLQYDGGETWPSDPDWDVVRSCVEWMRRREVSGTTGELPPVSLAAFSHALGINTGRSHRDLPMGNVDASAWPTRRELSQDISVMPGLTAELTVDVRSLVTLAQDQRIPLGSAFARLSRYRPLVMHWHLPDELPDAVAERAPSPIELGVYEIEALSGIDPALGVDWRLRIIRHSVLAGLTVPETVDGSLELLRLGGEDTGPVEALAATFPRHLKFDDLLVLATQQFTPPIRDPQVIVELCAPVSRHPDRLPEKAQAWLTLGPIRLGPEPPE
ncbi:hypothetical protein ACFPIJ_59835 [Dactylosporangium cerinum]|uniref:non-specific serine/threonine protein kinase n=1 Tax=Dactylosporangium cerinum TaxID=1434730 RepID=A0ABV9WJS1_9ACTN